MQWLKNLKSHSPLHFFKIIHTIETLLLCFIISYQVLTTILVNIIILMLYLVKWSAVRPGALPKIAEEIKESDLKYKYHFDHTGHSFRLLIYIWKETADWFKSLYQNG